MRSSLLLGKNLRAFTLKNPNETGLAADSPPKGRP